MSGQALIHLVCGSTGAGKTTYAIKLAERIGALRFSIDEWMSALFWMDSPQPILFEWTIERVRRCEMQIWSTAAQAARREVPVLLDLGLGRREHRQSFYDRAAEAGFAVQLHVLDVDAEERWRRVQQRNVEKGDTYRLEVTREMFDFVDAEHWHAPTPEEMAAYAGIRTGSSV